MKPHAWLSSLVLGVAILGGCKKKKDEPTPPPPAGSELEVLKGDLTGEKRLDASKKYLIEGNYIVRAGGILRIPAGTIIFGDRRTKGTLIIDRGGKIFAEGAPDKPIIFTSKFGPGERDRGDWGGVIILGKAPVNQSNVAIEGVSPPVEYGGNDPNDNSGVLKYVRIEFAGVALTPNNEVNSLTMGGVGRGTEIHHVQVSYGGDDGFEWFGGTVDGKHLVSYATWDDDFDVDFGYRGRVQFGLAIRDPFGADQSGSNGFECDNDAAGSTATPLTAPVFSNITVIGPIDRRGAGRSSNYQNAIHFRRNASVSLFNSVVAGFPTGFRVDGNSTASHYQNQNDNAIVSHNVLIIDSGNVNNRFASNPASTSPTPQNIWETIGTGNQVLVDTNLAILGGYSATQPMPFFRFIQGQAQPDIKLPSGSPLATGADFNQLDNFFERVPYRGGISPDGNWIRQWTHFDPLGAQY